MKLFTTLFTLSTVLISSQAQEEIRMPGLSASLDYQDFNSMKEPMMKSILDGINNLVIPDIPFTGGYMNQNKLFVNHSAQDLIFEPSEEDNSLLLQLKNFGVNIVSGKFSYSLLTIPLNGHLNANIEEVLFRIKIQFNKIQSKTGRSLPQINVTECEFKYQPDKIKIDLGGNILYNILDVLLPVIQKMFSSKIQTMVRDGVMNSGPNALNKFINDTDGYLNLGQLAPDSFPKKDPLSFLTFDYELVNDIKITKERIQFGIDGSFFNKDIGKRFPEGFRHPIFMPAFDSEIPSKLQVFVSHYTLETALRAYFQKQNISYELLAADYADQTVAPLDTNTLEGIFPFLTTRYGKKVPTDIKFTVNDVWGIEAFDQNRSDILNMTGRLNAKMNIQADITLRYNNTPKPKSLYIGKVEFLDCNFSTYINQTNQTILSTWLHSLNVTEQWIDTIYTGKYRSSPFVINTATGILAGVLNEEVFMDADMLIDINLLTFGLFKIQDPTLNYYPGYIAAGMSANFTNSTLLKDAHPVVKALFNQEYKSNEEWVMPPSLDEQVTKEMIEVDRKIGEMMQRGEKVIRDHPMEEERVI